jgi:hypothetical protein
MGRCAANNLFKVMMTDSTPETKTVELLTTTGSSEEAILDVFPEVPPMMALSVGHSAVSFTPKTGVTSGEAVMASVFKDDLGLKGCWEDLHLGEPRLDS